ncbi:radical SAM protein [bacterium]|nr:radical SAM protein [bacterium]
MKDKININSIEISEIYGPGKRLVVWFQGCSIRCKGCWNYEMWSFESKNPLSVNELLNKIQEKKDEIEGITILGGEPFDQSTLLLDFLERFKYEFPKLSIILYTGYKKSQFKEIDLKIIKLSDILIANPYEEDKRDITLNLRGSSNQSLEFISDFYNIEDFLDGETKVEIKILPSGEMVILGYPEKSLINEIKIMNN